MKKQAQASLEYLMTYDWALILIASVVGVLVFVIGPVENDAWHSSHPNKIMPFGGVIKGDGAQIKLRNITGGEIEILWIKEIGYDNCTINGQLAAGLTIKAGEEMSLECEKVYYAKGPITIRYADFAGLEQTAEITGPPHAPTATGIDSVQIVLDQPGIYVLNKDFEIENVAGWPIWAIQIESDNIILDCMDHTITDLDEYDHSNVKGVFLNNVNNVTVKNCKFQGMLYSIRQNYGSGNKLLNNEISDNLQYGIYVYEASDGEISNNSVLSTNQKYATGGIRLDASTDFKLKSNKTYGDILDRGLIINNGKNIDIIRGKYCNYGPLHWSIEIGYEGTDNISGSEIKAHNVRCTIGCPAEWCDPEHLRWTPC